MTDGITNGTVSIEDGIKASEEYAPARKVRVELSFTIPEGADPVAFLDGVRALASSRVGLLLNKQPAKQPAITASEVLEIAAKTTRKAKEKPAKEAATDKDKLAEAAGLPTTDIVSKAPVEPAQSDIEDDMNDLLGDQAPVPITDAELAKAAQNKNGQMKGKDPNFSVKIRALVVEYAGGPPKKITDVPVAKRQEFLDKLRDLT